ncbi:PHP domain-containing protein [Candidatus Daviesbacteria bacterium]|nr:PHP domain-containing protein [Candidatus Daviesbacteria bacterium]
MRKGYCEFDLHGHTKYSAFPTTINYSPEDVVIRAKEVGLDGIAITGHDTIKGLDEGLNSAIKHGLIVIPGIEITSRIGSKTPHILALGIAPDDICRSKYKIPRYKDPCEVIAWIHDFGGVAIAAHPSKRWLYTSLSYKQVIKYHDIIDGIEVITAHGQDEQLEVIAKESNIAGLGCSDFHSLDEIGLAVTRVFGQVSNYEDVLQAIKEKKVKAFSQTNEQYSKF